MARLRIPYRKISSKYEGPEGHIFPFKHYLFYFLAGNFEENLCESSLENKVHLLQDLLLSLSPFGSHFLLERIHVLAASAISNPIFVLRITMAISDTLNDDFVRFFQPFLRLHIDYTEFYIGFPK